MRVTVWIAALTNLAIGTLVLLGAPRALIESSIVHPEAIDRLGSKDGGEQTPHTLIDRPLWFSCAFASGFITIGIQVLWSRILSMIIGSSTYAFTLVLALFLVGLALGTWIVGFIRKTENLRLRRLLFGVQ